MSPLVRDWRPLPDEIVIVAYPEAFLPAERQAGSAIPGAFFVVMAPPADIHIAPPAQPWLKLGIPTSIGSDLSRIDYAATTNPRQARTQDITVSVRQRQYQVHFRQAGGALAQKEMVGLLNAPANLDCLVAVTYAASLIRKLQPPPLKLVVLIVAVLAVVAIAFAVATLRHAFIDVPEPAPLSTDSLGIPINLFPGLTAPAGLLPLPGIAVEDQVIALQMLRQLYWLLRQAQ